jgi:hypothetical protein
MNRTAKGVLFKEKTQTYIKVSEETANVSFIKEKMKENKCREIMAKEDPRRMLCRRYSRPTTEPNHQQEKYVIMLEYPLG